MTDEIPGVVVSGGQIFGPTGNQSVVIENFVVYTHAPEAPPSSVAGKAVAPPPYPGLAYFGPDDTEQFFGRGAAIGKLVAAITRQSLTALVGASGSGKSSVVLAGLAPRLHRDGGWLFSYFRIGHELDHDPFLALARALVPFYVQSKTETDQLVNTRKLAQNLGSGELALRDVFAACRNQNKGRRILLIADQFEEAFTLVADDATRNHFVDVLLSGFADPLPGERPDICLVLTLRADFYGRALRYRPLSDALQTHVENLGPMTRSELATAIVEPATRAAVTFEPGLVQTLLDDVERRPGSLPLLQFALREMWGLQRGGQITRDSYDGIGGIEGALATRAEVIFTRLTEFDAKTQRANRPEIERDFRLLFTRLVTLGEGQEDTRRVVVHRELNDTAWSLAQRLADEENRLVVTNAPTERVADKPGETGESAQSETVEVVHEALIRHWPRLVDWIDRDRAFQSWLAQIRSNVGVWISDRSDEAPLLRGGMLAQGVEWFAKRRDGLNEDEEAYIEASIGLRRREEEQREAAARSELKRQQDLAEAASQLAAEQQQRAADQAKLAEEQRARAEAADQLAVEQHQRAAAQAKLADAQRQRAVVARVFGLVSGLVAVLAVALVVAVAWENHHEIVMDYPLAHGQANQTQPPLDANPSHPFIVMTLSGSGSRGAVLGAAIVDRLNHLHYTAGGEMRVLANDIAVVSSVSGGSVYAADLGLSGTTHAASFIQRMQEFDGIGWLQSRSRGPLTWISRQLGHKINGDLLQEMIDDLLQTKTTSTLSAFSRPDGPLILLTATDSVTGQVFTFDRPTLDDICMDYDRVPVSLGVTASTAHPTSFTPVQLRNDSYLASGCPGQRNAHLPYRVLLQMAGGPYANMETYERALYRQSLRNETVRQSGSGDEVPPFATPAYLRLVDGGLADNSNLIALSRVLLSAGAPADIGRVAAQGKLRHLVVIAVNDFANSAAAFQDFITLLINDRDTLVSQGQLQANFAIYPIWIGLDQLPSATALERDEKARGKSAGASWTLRPGDGALLDHIAGKLLWRHPCFRLLVADIGLQGNPEADPVPGTVCAAEPPLPVAAPRTRSPK